MKSLKSIFCVMLISITIGACAQPNKNAKTEAFHVWGNCGMCKKTIEKAANKVKGVAKAEWDEDKKIMNLSYDTTLTSPEAVQKAIAAVGYDTEKAKGDDKAYADLPECCQYERKK